MQKSCLHRGPMLEPSAWCVVIPADVLILTLHLGTRSGDLVNWCDWDKYMSSTARLDIEYGLAQAPQRGKGIARLEEEDRWEWEFWYVAKSSFPLQPATCIWWPWSLEIIGKEDAAFVWGKSARLCWFLRCPGSDCLGRATMWGSTNWRSLERVLGR